MLEETKLVRAERDRLHLTCTELESSMHDVCNAAEERSKSEREKYASMKEERDRYKMELTLTLTLIGGT